MPNGLRKGDGHTQNLSGYRNVASPERPAVPSHNPANTNAIRQIHAGRPQASPTIVSEHVQFVRDLSCDCAFLVIGYDEFVGAEDPQHRIIYALLQGQKRVQPGSTVLKSGWPIISGSVIKALRRAKENWNMPWGNGAL